MAMTTLKPSFSSSPSLHPSPSQMGFGNVPLPALEYVGACQTQGELTFKIPMRKAGPVVVPQDGVIPAA